MTRWLKLLTCLVLVSGVALAAPVAALAGGPSAGDQQYVDPLKASSHHSSSSSSTSTSAPTSVSSTSSTSTATSSGTTSPSSTVATSSSSASVAGDPQGTLPFTGFNIWTGAAVGVLLLGCGACLRRVTRHT